jgi:hypothetical protein
VPHRLEGEGAERCRCDRRQVLVRGVPPLGDVDDWALLQPDELRAEVGMACSES